MNAKIKPSDYDKARLEKEVFASVVETCEDNLAMMLIALKLEFGFGPERLKRVCERFTKVSEKFTEYKTDGYTEKEIHEKYCEEIKALGLNPSDIYSGTMDFYQVELDRRMAKKNNTPTFAEAAYAQKHLAAMKELSGIDKPFNYEQGFKV